jgi:hypothetical protein
MPGVLQIGGARLSPQFGPWHRYPDEPPMGAAVAEEDQPREDGVSTVAAAAPPVGSYPPAVAPYPPPVSPFPLSNGSPSHWNGSSTGTAPPPLAIPSTETEDLSADPSPSTAAAPSSSAAPATPSTGPAPEPFILHGLLLLESDGDDPVDIDSLTFTDDGIGVTRTRGEQARVLPWTSVAAHVVEAWGGGVIPEWWVDPELNRRSVNDGPSDSVVDPGATNRALPHSEAGALIGIKTQFGTYRFLLPGGDARQLARQVTAFAVRNQGPAGASSVTRVVAWGLDAERRKVKRRPKRAVTWSNVQPFLVVALIVFIATAVTLILLQSAGTIHLPFLGGSGPAMVGLFRTQ